MAFMQQQEIQETWDKVFKAPMASAPISYSSFSTKPRTSSIHLSSLSVGCHAYMESNKTSKAGDNLPPAQPFLVHKRGNVMLELTKLDDPLIWTGSTATVNQQIMNAWKICNSQQQGWQTFFCEIIPYRSIKLSCTRQSSFQQALWPIISKPWKPLNQLQPPS